jgi:hypothetical protein
MAQISIDCSPHRCDYIMKYVFGILALSMLGCASQSGIQESDYQTQERRIEHNVFYSNWLRPAVSEDDKEFFYRSFLKNSNM